MRPRPNTIVGWLTALAFVALSAACGDDGSTTATSNSSAAPTVTAGDTTTGTVSPDNPDEPTPAPEPSTPKVTATGRVTDEEGAPVARSILDLEALDGQPNPAIESLRLTDDDGRYFLAIAPGRWILTIAADGFTLATVELDIPVDDVLETDVVLTRL